MVTDEAYEKFRYILYRPEGGGGLPLVVVLKRVGG
jgi:hypothetical protein